MTIDEARVLDAAIRGLGLGLLVGGIGFAWYLIKAVARWFFAPAQENGAALIAAQTMSDPVDTFRRISWLVFKWILWAVLACVVLVGGLVGLIYGHQWYTHDRHKAVLDYEVNSKNTICKERDYPIFVGIINKSSRTIEKLTFTLKANRPGRSTNLVRYHTWTDDQIVKPTESSGACWSVPELTEKGGDARELEWGFQHKSVTFKD